VDGVPAEQQDFQSFLAQYRAQHADDVLVFGDEVAPEQEISAVVDTLERQGRRPCVPFRERARPGSDGGHQHLRLARAHREVLWCNTGRAACGLPGARGADVRAADRRVRTGVRRGAARRHRSAPPAVAQALRDRPRPLHHQRGDRGPAPRHRCRQHELPPLDGGQHHRAGHQPAFARRPLAAAADRCRARPDAAGGHGDRCASAGDDGSLGAPALRRGRAPRRRRPAGRAAAGCAHAAPRHRRAGRI
jgi:hypothetical protein